MRRCEPGNPIRGEISWIFLQVKIKGSPVHCTAGNGFELLPGLYMRADERFVRGWRIRSNNRIAVFEFIRRACKDHLEPAASHLQTQIQCEPQSARLKRNRTPLHCSFERRFKIERLGVVAVRFVFRDLLSLNVDLGRNRRPGIVAEEFAHLPLLTYHPQSVANFRAQSAIEIVCPRPAFQSIVTRKRGQQRFA